MKREGRIMANKTKKRRNSEQHKTLFPLLLAAVYSKPHCRRILIVKCLNKVIPSLPHVELSPILAWLPSLLKFSCAEIVCRSAEVIGAASLASFEMNEKIALDDGIVKGLISLLGSSKREIAVASCNAVLDLSTTLVGRQRLLEFSAVENLILCFIQETSSSNMKLLEKNEYATLLLQGAFVLINSCTIDQLQLIPMELSEKFSGLLKRIWGQANKIRLCGTSSKCNPVDEFCISNIKTNNLVESIFRLSINDSLHTKTIDLEKNIFDLEDVGIEPFLSEIWETSPMIIKNASKNTLSRDSIFSPFIQYLGLQEGIPYFLSSFLKRIISCPTIASDELDILQVIKEIKNNLGFPIIYHQDIRVVKTEYGERELHYFQEQSYSQDPHILSINDILKCEEAFIKEGYSIALRGIEFRDRMIASIADGLASLLGQPSAGVNMYLTPSNSQGLARHSDDHCVFVSQIIGAKRWRVFPRSDFQLPRLYESCDSFTDLEGKSLEFAGCRQFVLKEGDVLYIPRGCPHEAVADVDDYENVNNAAGFSLHLTLAIEIEPPFEWEGFMHVAVYCWDKKQNALQYKSGDSVACSLHLVSVMLLHIAIKLIGGRDFGFRKACLVGAMPLSSETRDWLCENQRTTFGCLISTIISESKFSDTVEHLEAALQVNEDPLECVRWMKYITVEEEEEIERSKSFILGKIGINNPNFHWFAFNNPNYQLLSNNPNFRGYLLSMVTAGHQPVFTDDRGLFDVLRRHRDITEAAFLQVKSRFCREVEFEDVKQRYLVLLENYRKVRKQYANGMLSLHSCSS